MLDAAAAALLYFGVSATAYAQDAPKPSLDSRVTAQEAASPQDAKPAQEPKAEAPKQEVLQESDLEQKARAAYDKGKTEKKGDGQINTYLESLKNYKLADKAAKATDPGSKTYDDHITIITDYVAVAKYNKIVKDLDDVQKLELKGIILNYDLGKPYVTPQQPEPKPDVKPEPKPEPTPEPKPDVKPEPKPDVKPEPTPEPKPDVKPDQTPPQPEPKPKPQDTVPAEPKPQGPYENNLLSLKGAAGPDARRVSAYGRLEGIEALAEFDRNAFKTIADRVNDKRFGGYANADFDRLAGLPLRVDASFSHEDATDRSSSSSFTDNANFRVDTTTNVTQTTGRTRFSLGGDLLIDDYELSAHLYQLQEKIDVDAETLLSVLNKFDPAGSYNDVIRNSQSFTNTTRGGQAGFASKFSSEVKGGILLTLEETEMPEFQRTVDLYRADLWLSYLSDNQKKALKVILGQGLQNDAGEKLTRGDYGIVGTADLGKLVLASARFSYHNDPRGAFTLLLGKHDGAVPYVSEFDIGTVQSELDLDKRMDRNLLQSYIELRHNDLTRWLAEKQEWEILATVGAARANDAGQKRTVYNWDITLLAPLFKDVTVGARVYRAEDAVSKREGIELMAFPFKKDWRFAIIGEQEDLPGQGKKDRRGLLAWDLWSK